MKTLQTIIDIAAVFSAVLIPTTVLFCVLAAYPDTWKCIGAAVTAWGLYSMFGPKRL